MNWTIDTFVDILRRGGFPEYAEDFQRSESSESPTTPRFLQQRSDASPLSRVFPLSPLSRAEVVFDSARVHASRYLENSFVAFDTPRFRPKPSKPSSARTKKMKKKRAKKEREEKKEEKEEMKKTETVQVKKRETDSSIASTKNDSRHTTTTLVDELVQGYIPPYSGDALAACYTALPELPARVFQRRFYLLGTTHHMSNPPCIEHELSVFLSIKCVS